MARLLLSRKTLVTPSPCTSFRSGERTVQKTVGVTQSLRVNVQKFLQHNQLQVIFPEIYMFPGHFPNPRASPPVNGSFESGFFGAPLSLGGGLGGG